jgi:hypothetical protein
MRHRREKRPPKHQEEVAPENIWAVTASSDYKWPAAWIACPSNVLDLDETTMWNARTFAPAWIRFDLGPSAPCVTRLELLPSMKPTEGEIEHQIQMGTSLCNMSTAVTINGKGGDREWIVCRLPQSRRTRFLEVLTTRSPSWVAWVRIRIWVE